MRRFLSLTILLLLSATACQKGATSTAANPQSATDYYNRGVERQSKGDLNAAIADYTKAIELDPKSFSAYNNRGNVRQDRGDFKGAISDFMKAADINPQYATAYFNLAYAYQSRNDFQGAIQQYGKAIAVKPDYAMAYANRGLCQLYAGSDAEAQKDFDRSIELNGQMKSSLDGYIAKVKQERAAKR